MSKCQWAENYCIKFQSNRVPVQLAVMSWRPTGLGSNVTHGPLLHVFSFLSSCKIFPKLYTRLQLNINKNNKTQEVAEQVCSRDASTSLIILQEFPFGFLQVIHFACAELCVYVLGIKSSTESVAICQGCGMSPLVQHQIFTDRISMYIILKFCIFQDTFIHTLTVRQSRKQSHLIWLNQS